MQGLGQRAQLLRSGFEGVNTALPHTERAEPVPASVLLQGLCSSASIGPWEGQGQSPAAGLSTWWLSSASPQWRSLCEQVSCEWVSAPETLLPVLLVLLDLTSHLEFTRICTGPIAST